jgi:hypothetical protein
MIIRLQSARAYRWYLFQEVLSKTFEMRSRDFVPDGPAEVHGRVLGHGCLCYVASGLRMQVSDFDNKGVTYSKQGDNQRIEDPVNELLQDLAALEILRLGHPLSRITESEPAAVSDTQTLHHLVEREGVVLLSTDESESILRIVRYLISY